MNFKFMNQEYIEYLLNKSFPISQYKIELIFNKEKINKNYKNSYILKLKLTILMVIKKKITILLI